MLDFGNISVVFIAFQNHRRVWLKGKNFPFQPARDLCSSQQFHPCPSSVTHPTEKPGNDRISLYFHTHGALIPSSVLWDEEGGKWDGNRMGETIREFHL